MPSTHLGINTFSHCDKQWLCEEHFVDLIVDKFIDETDQERQESASMMLYELTTYFSSQCDSPLIQRLESQEIVDKLFKYITTTVSFLSSHNQLASCCCCCFYCFCCCCCYIFRMSKFCIIFFPLAALHHMETSFSAALLLCSRGYKVLQNHFPFAALITTRKHYSMLNCCFFPYI